VANAQSVATADGALQFAQLGDFKLRGGSVISDFRLGYRTLGRLNSARSNGILWPSWLGGTTENLLQVIGPGKVVDTTNYLSCWSTLSGTVFLLRRRTAISSR